MATHKVTFQDTDYWFLEEDGEGPLAPLDHCDDEGEILFSKAFELSFAHVFADGNIRRFNTVIGQRAELQEYPMEES